MRSILISSHPRSPSNPKKLKRQTNGSSRSFRSRSLSLFSHGNKYYENPNETMWRHRWVDYNSVRPVPPRFFRPSRRHSPLPSLPSLTQDDPNASQVTPEWHSWLNHIRKDSPDLDPIVLASRQAWQTVRPPSGPSPPSPLTDMGTTATLGEPDGNERCFQDLFDC